MIQDRETLKEVAVEVEEFTVKWTHDIQRDEFDVRIPHFPDSLFWGTWVWLLKLRVLAVDANGK